MKNYSLEDKVEYYKKKEKEYQESVEKNKVEIENLNIFLKDYKKKFKNIKNEDYNIELLKLKDKNIETDKILGTWHFDETGHRCIDVECNICKKRRSIKSSVFFSERPLKCYKCICQTYLPKPDYTYMNTIRGFDIFIGMGNIEKGNQMIWVKCLKCNQYRKVKGEDFLLGKCENTCTHKIEKDNIRLNKNDFMKIDTYYDPNDFYEGQDIGEDIFVKFEKRDTSYTFAVVQCKSCGKIRKIAYSEFLRANGHTLAYRQCSCKGKFEIIIGGIYGNLKVLSYDIKRKEYRCQCLCPEKTIVYRSKYKLQNGVSLSCGCLSKSLKGEFNKEKYRNKVFNDLKVIDFYKIKPNVKIEDFTEKRRVYWGCKCLRCNNYTIMPARYIQNGSFTNCGCKNNRFFNEYNVGDFIDDFEILDIIKEKGVGTYWNVKCPFCKTPFVRLASNIVLGHYKSCGCLQRSFGELLVIEILKKHKLKYKEQKSFKDLKNGALRFDFEVEYNGNSYLIEFDGMQHYSENAQFIKNKKVQRSNFNRLRENDRLKDDYCLTKHIPLLRIKYTLNKDEIEKQILEFLKKNYKNMGG